MDKEYGGSGPDFEQESKKEILIPGIILKTLNKALSVLKKEGANPTISKERMGDILICDPDLAFSSVKEVPGFELLESGDIKIVDFGKVEKYLTEHLEQIKNEIRVEINPQKLADLKKFFNENPTKKLSKTEIAEMVNLRTFVARDIISALEKEGFLTAEETVIRGRKRTVY